MALEDLYDSQIAYNPDTEELVTGAVFQVFAPDDSAYATPLPLTDPASGAGIPTLRSSNIGVLPAFRVAGDLPQAILKSGSFITQVTSRYGLLLDVVPDPTGFAEGVAAAVAARAAAESARDQMPAAVADAVTAADIPGAVAAAVDADVAGRDLLEGGDVLETDVIFAVVDEEGRRTQLELGVNGRFTPRALQMVGDDLEPRMADVAADTAAELGITEQDENASGILFAVVDEEGRRTELEVGPDGRFTQRVVDSLGARLNVQLPVPAVPEANFLYVGHSMMAGCAADVTAALSTIGRSGYSIAVGGESMATISTRLGSHPVRVTFTAGTIPATVTAATITLSADGAGSLVQGASSYAVTLILPDGTTVPGTFSKSGSDFTFTRSTAGSTIPVTRPVRMLYDVSESRRSRTFLFWSARNGSWTSTNAVRERLDRMEGMIRHQRALDRRFLVISEHKSGGDSADVQAAINDYNRQAYLRWGDRFIDSQQYLIDYGLSDRGITPTAQDTIDIAAGIVPTSLRGDALHLNSDGNAVMGSLVLRRVIELGW